MIMELEIFRRTGIMALGSKMRMFTDFITDQAADVYRSFGLDIQPKWFPVLFIVIGDGPISVSAIAACIGHSHPSVIKITREIEKAGLVEAKTSDTDRRSTLISLTEKGREIAPKLCELLNYMTAVLDKIVAQTGVNLWTAMVEWKECLERETLAERIVDEQKSNESQRLRILFYDDAKHRKAFFRLNERWISEMFHMEEIDYLQIRNAQKSIIDKGGYAFIAELDGVPVGTLAMTRFPGEYDWELIKLAVDPSAQGHGAGLRLLEAAVNHGRMLGARTLFLETNHNCTAAIHLYHKVGFHDIPVTNAEFERCDVQMVMDLQ